MSEGTEEPSGRGKLITQQSTVWTRKQHAVCVRRACKVYGSKSARHVILDNLNMTVPKGAIYGLLGASGCGKTTLLSCIVGRRRLNSGEIWVLGGRPGSKGSGVPGPRVGYMPQEMALYGEFSVRETLKYFGWIAGLTTDQIESRTNNLLDLLQLPFPERRVKNLSGGQQRRVSMAATFLHEPELLILDEPTVGVDPVLRQRIWDYLVGLTANKTTTIIITTHYIDETKQATMIGLMRGGRFLAEEPPADILTRYQSDSLEDAFLKLSLLQNKGKRRRSSITSNVTAVIPDAALAETGIDTTSEISGEFGDNMSVRSGRTSVALASPPTDVLPPEEEVEISWTDRLRIFAPHHMKALVWKNMLWMLRNVPVLLFTLLLPVIEITIFCLSIGIDPVGLKLAIVNHDSPGALPCPYPTPCTPEGLSCRYLHFLSKRKHNLVSYPDDESAREAVAKGDAWATVTFPETFSQTFYDRMSLYRILDPDLEDDFPDNSSIHTHLDMSNQQIAFLLQRDFLLTFRDFTNDLRKSCDFNPVAVFEPIRFEQNIFGPEIPNFTNFAAPGVMLTIVFFLSVSLTSGTMLIERNEGMLERCLVSGITGIEILSSHVVTQFVVMVVQACLILTFALLVFSVTNLGSLVLVVLLVILSGTCGISYGFVVSCLVDDERSATYLALGSFLPFVMLCGIIWPVQGMDRVLRSISYFLPLTLSTESLRSILGRGWDISHPTVYSGFVSTVTWILVYMIVSILLLKFKKG